MSKKDIFGDEAATKKSEDFASMFEQSFQAGPRKIKNGDSFTGEILSMNKDSVFVSTPTPTDGVLPTAEILDENKIPKFKVGDKIDVVVVRVRADEVFLRYKGAKGASDVESLEDAFDMELPVEGRVLEVVKGGFRIQIQTQKAFCPVSQIDLRPVTAQQDLVGQKFNFLITQFENNGRNIVVSRRKLLEMEKAENEGTFLQSHKVGDIVTGTISRMEKFGAFILLSNGLEGLCHISEVGWSRLQDPSEVLRLGQSVSAKILSVEEMDSRLKISLSIKQGGGESDPWLMVPQKFPVGSQWDGTVEKKEAYGLFVQIAPGVTGLLPKSKWRDSTESSQYESRKKGDKIKVQVDQILFEERKISLGLPSEAADESWREHQKSNSGFGSLANAFAGLKISSDVGKKK